MPEVGVEPTRGCPQRILSPPRLPFRHSGIQKLLLKNPAGAQVFFIISQTKPHPYTPKNGIPALEDKHILLIVVVYPTAFPGGASAVILLYVSSCPTWTSLGTSDILRTNERIVVLSFASATVAIVIINLIALSDIAMGKYHIHGIRTLIMRCAVVLLGG